MITEKLRKILELLKAKTVDKKAIWNKASGNNQFKLSINDGSAITVNAWTGQYNDIFYGVTIFNSNGDAIERIDTEDFEFSVEDFNLIKSFHKAASDSYFIVEETMDALFASISNQDVIGNKEEEEEEIPDFDEDDDLPF